MSAKDKKAVHSDIRGKFINTQQTEAYRQLMRTENRILATKNKNDLERMKDHLEKNINYLSLYKKEDFAATQTMKQQQEQTVEDFYKSLPFYCDTVNNFDPKSKKDRTWTIHKAKEGPLSKQIYDMPVTTSQEIGWRPPIDNLNLGYGLKNSFEVFGSNFRDAPKKKGKDGQ